MLYFALLLILLALVFFDRRAEGGVPAGGRSPGLVGASVAGRGALAGSALFAVELWMTALVRVLPWVRQAAVHPVTEGSAASPTSSVKRSVGFATLMVVGLAIEEIIWRGHLLEFLSTRWGASWPVAVAVSGLAFGLNHAYFGARSAVFKTLDGIAWGVLALASGLLWAAVVSHLTFNLWVSRRILRGRRHERSDADLLDRVRPAV